MDDRFELIIDSDGNIQTIYRDGIEELANEMGAEISTVCRASHVEPEEIDGRKGWTVRSAKNPEFALRTTDWCTWKPGFEDAGQVTVFPTRDEAIKEEIRFFWELLRAETKKEEGS